MTHIPRRSFYLLMAVIWLAIGIARIMVPQSRLYDHLFTSLSFINVVGNIWHWDTARRLSQRLHKIEDEQHER